MHAYDRHEVPRYTASLDAALSLVPEGCRWHCQWVQSQGFAWATVGEGNPMREPFGNRMAKARTPALALCAAAMRARLAMQEAGDVAPE